MLRLLRHSASTDCIGLQDRLQDNPVTEARRAAWGHGEEPRLWKRMRENESPVCLAMRGFLGGRWVSQLGYLPHEGRRVNLIHQSPDMAKKKNTERGYFGVKKHAACVLCVEFFVHLGGPAVFSLLRVLNTSGLGTEAPWGLPEDKAAKTLEMLQFMSELPLPTFSLHLPLLQHLYSEGRMCPRTPFPRLILCGPGVFKGNDLFYLIKSWCIFSYLMFLWFNSASYRLFPNPIPPLTIHSWPKPSHLKICPSITLTSPCHFTSLHLQAHTPPSPSDSPCRLLYFHYRHPQHLVIWVYKHRSFFILSSLNLAFAPCPSFFPLSFCICILLSRSKIAWRIQASAFRISSLSAINSISQLMSAGREDARKNPEFVSLHETWVTGGWEQPLNYAPRRAKSWHSWLNTSSRKDRDISLVFLPISASLLNFHK